MNDDPIYLTIQVSRGGLKILNQIIGAGLDERGDPDGEEGHLEDAHRMIDMLRDKARGS